MYGAKITLWYNECKTPQVRRFIPLFNEPRAACHFLNIAQLFRRPLSPQAERITKKLGQFAISAWEGDYDRVKEFASDVRKLGMPVEHAPQISQLLKLGTQHYEDVKRFASYVEETLFKVSDAEQQRCGR